MLDFLTRRIFAVILQRLDQIMTTNADAIAQLNTIATTLDKISGETQMLLNEIEALKAAASASGDISPDMEAAINAVASRATGIDELVVDQPAAPTA